MESYCEAILEIMQDRKLRADLSDGARSFMLDRFNPKLIVDQYLKVIENVS